ncbi:MAG: hypothetical protein AAFP19_23940 [Bacteroidota bacterium]
MDAIFKKLNFKEQSPILVIHAPESFSPNMQAMAGLTTFVFDLGDLEKITFAIAFVTKQEEINKLVPQIIPKLEGDAILWFCYPKGSSKKYTCDFNRDTGWQIMGEHDMEGVRMVAIDQDWSAIRFRNIQYIKNFTRRKSMALSKKGKSRTTKK